MNGFLEQLQEQPLLGDGAMGTLLLGRGIGFDQCLEALVVEQPAMVAAVHAEYARAGADMITTHTFGANRLRLAHHGLASKVRDFNGNAVAIVQQVRAATGRDFWIAGNVGPVGRMVIWADDGEFETVAEAYAEQIGALAEAGVDLLLFETFSDVQELELAVQVSKTISPLPIVASMSYGDDGVTLMGQGVGEATRQLISAGADVVGANCSVGPAQMVETLRVMREAAPDTLLSVTPNAGLPVLSADGLWRYPVEAEEFAAYLPTFLAMGARLVGGCCGTTPEHTAAMRRVMDSR